MTTLGQVGILLGCVVGTYGLIVLACMWMQHQSVKRRRKDLLRMIEHHEKLIRNARPKIGDLSDWHEWEQQCSDIKS